MELNKLVRMAAGVDGEGVDHPQVLPHHLNLVIPTALRHQYVGELCSGPEELCRVVGIPSSKHLEVREDCLTPVCQKLYSETLFLIRSGVIKVGLIL